MMHEPGLHYPRAEHAGRLRLGSIELHRYVLDDGRRVFTQQGMLNALGITFGGIGQQGRYRLGNFIAHAHWRITNKPRARSLGLVLARTFLQGCSVTQWWCERSLGNLLSSM
jgi:hypothetical protein